MIFHYLILKPNSRSSYYMFFSKEYFVDIFLYYFPGYKNSFTYKEQLSFVDIFVVIIFPHPQYQQRHNYYDCQSNNYHQLCLSVPFNFFPFLFITSTQDLVFVLANQDPNLALIISVLILPLYSVIFPH